MLSSDNEFGMVLRALKFASLKHRYQRRKDKQTPYINHPIDVADLLYHIGQVRDVRVLSAALLHDTLEDTDTTPDEIESLFGSEVLYLVQEVSDDTSLSQEQRRRLQIDSAPHKSLGAKHIKLADKISNVRDVTISPPPSWSLQRRKDYLDWTEKVIAKIRGINQHLENLYDEWLSEARQALNSGL